MWTEIRTENVGVTHVGDIHVCWPLGDVSEDEVRYVKKSLLKEHVWKNNLERLKELGDEIEKDIEFNKILNDHGVDLSGPTNQAW